MLDNSSSEMISLSFSQFAFSIHQLIYTSVETLDLECIGHRRRRVDQADKSETPPVPFGNRTSAYVADQPLLEQLLQLQRPDVRRIDAGKSGLQAREAIAGAKDLAMETLVIALQVLLVDIID